MTSPAVLAVLATALALLPALAAAQDASPRTDTGLLMETTRRRLIVRPAAPVAGAFRDAERATDELAARRFAEAAAAPARVPQLQYDVTSAIQSRNLQRARRR